MYIILYSSKSLVTIISSYIYKHDLQHGRLGRVVFALKVSPLPQIGHNYIIMQLTAQTLCAHIVFILPACWAQLWEFAVLIYRCLRPDASGSAAATANTDVAQIRLGKCGAAKTESGNVSPIMLDKQSVEWSQRQQRAKGKCPAGIRFPRVKCYLKSSWRLTLTLFPPSLRLPPFSTPASKLTRPSVVSPPPPLFSGCSKCLETAVGAGTGPSGRPNQGMVGPGWHQNHGVGVREDGCFSRDIKVRQLSSGQMLITWGWIIKSSLSTPTDTYTVYHFWSTFFFNWKATVGVWFYIHNPFSGSCFTWWLSPLSLNHYTLKGVFSTSFFCMYIHNNETREGSWKDDNRRIRKLRSSFLEIRKETAVKCFAGIFIVGVPQENCFGGEVSTKAMRNWSTVMAVKSRWGVNMAVIYSKHKYGLHLYSIPCTLRSLYKSKGSDLGLNPAVIWRRFIGEHKCTNCSLKTKEHSRLVREKVVQKSKAGWSYKSHLWARFKESMAQLQTC